VVIGTAAIPTSIGRRTVFGHRCVVVGAAVGDLCEIGNASILMPGARLGRRVFLGEGTLVPSGMTLPDDTVAVGRPARVIRRASDADLARLTGLRGGDLSLPPATSIAVTDTSRYEEHSAMGQLYAYRNIMPTIAASAALFPSAEITGDVVIGAHDHRRGREDHRGLARTRAHRRRRADPREHRAAPAAGQRLDPR